MTDIKIYERGIIRFRGIFLLSIFAAVSLGAYLGLKLTAFENCIIVPCSPFENGFFEGASVICFFDIAAFWVLTVPLSRVMTVTASFAVFFFRGMIIGNGCRIFFANSVYPLCVMLLFSYISVTMLLMIYGSYINTTGEKSAHVRILSCFIATGGAALVRILPMLLIK